MHLNNMLGEEDLNPRGYHRHAPGARVPSMMAPTVVLRDGRPELALGSAGSNRIRSAILQTILAAWWTTARDARGQDGGARAPRPATWRADDGWSAEPRRSTGDAARLSLRASAAGRCAAGTERNSRSSAGCQAVTARSPLQAGDARPGGGDRRPRRRARARAERATAEEGVRSADGLTREYVCDRCCRFARQASRSLPEHFSTQLDRRSSARSATRADLLSARLGDVPASSRRAPPRTAQSRRSLRARSSSSAWRLSAIVAAIP